MYLLGDFEGLWEPGPETVLSLLGAMGAPQGSGPGAPGEGGQGAGKGVGLRETTAGNPREPPASSGRFPARSPFVGEQRSPHGI